MIGKILKFVTPIISAIIGIFAASKFNIFELIPGIPSEHVYEICVTIYFAIADILVEEVKDGIWGRIKQKCFSEVEVIIHNRDAIADIRTNPILSFNNQEHSEAYISVCIKGKKKHFKNTLIQIKNPTFADIQQSYGSKAVSVDDDGYSINLEQLFRGNDSMESTQPFGIVLVKNPVDGESVATLSPIICNKKIGIIYKHNYAKIRTR